MSLFHDDDVTELGVNPFRRHVWVDTHSRDMVETNLALSDAEVQQFLQRAAGYSDDALQSHDPKLECSLPSPIWNGARLSGVVPPAVPSPSFCLRKFEDDLIPLESYVEDGIMSQRQQDRLLEAIRNYENIAVVGGTGSGKTTLLMSILNRMGRLFSDERFVTVEDTPEISLDSAWNWTPLYTFEGEGTDGSIKHLVHMSLRQSPDRLIVGECRGPGIVALFEALLSGHPGGAFTYHATTISQALKRMLINCKRESDTSAHKHNIGDAIDLIIILAKSHGVRYVRQMASIRGYDAGADQYRIDRVWRDPDRHVDYYTPPEVQRSRQSAAA
jgi:type IV secretion system protein VirB11